jgi:hypothetical protein
MEPQRTGRDHRYRVQALIAAPRSPKLASTQAVDAYTKWEPGFAFTTAHFYPSVLQAVPGRGYAGRLEWVLSGVVGRPYAGSWI